MKLSNQAMGAIMMALQKSLLEQTDIVRVLEQFNFKVDEEEALFVSNPPNFKFNSPQAIDESPDEDVFIDEKNKTVGSD